MILNINGEHDEKTLDQLRDVDSRAEYTALMADGHLGYIMPIGGVAAYRGQVSPVGVGFDIACGNAAVKTNLTVDQLPNLEQLADHIWNHYTFGVGGVNQHVRAPVEHSLFDDPRWDIIPAEHREELREKARRQLGTIGSGNHYVDVLVDEEGQVWVGVHFGSRGFGWTIASTFLALSQGGEWGDRGKEEEILLDIDDTYLGEDYWNLMELAGDYAYAGRDWVVDELADEMIARVVDRVHNHHNFAWREPHFGEDLIVVRKGATPAFPGQRGFVGGSMGDNAVILHGVNDAAGSPAHRAAIDNLYSTVHGAGRVMGRRAAKRALNPQEVQEWLDNFGVIRRGGDLDEAPQAYRRLPDVLAAQGSTVNVEHTLTPIIACMAG